MPGSSFDVVVIGGGHAGCEAALAAARIGASVALVTLRLDRIAHLPCNCSIGGPAKGQIVREIDALGGIMAMAADAATTHARWVGTSKGQAIRTLRVHADKALYPRVVNECLNAEPRITLIEGGVTAMDPGTRVLLADGSVLSTRAVVLTAGTFMGGSIHSGHHQTPGGRAGEAPDSALSAELRRLGLRLGRFKTGTPPRVHAGSVDWCAVEPLPSDDCPSFSFVGNRQRTRALLPCWATHTTPATHAHIRANLSLSALYGGFIVGAGPRYCPSIEDKIVRFPNRESHPVFLEQEGWDSPSIYIQGMSTSLPIDVQRGYLQTVPGLANASILAPGYAVEYDMVYPDQLTHTLAVRGVPGLFTAGQINGTSGYEEAAGQGLIAGANAALHALDCPPYELQRNEAYIGVLIDDLVTRGVEDPYRMLTSRAEHRLSLRHDNADLRLTPRARDLGLITDERWSVLCERRSAIAAETARLSSEHVSGADNEALATAGAGRVAARLSLLDLLRRPGIDYEWVRRWSPPTSPVSPEVGEHIATCARYDGYIGRQDAQVASLASGHDEPIPRATDYAGLSILSMEAREKLARVQPATLGAASRIPGVTPTDVQALQTILAAHRRAETDRRQ